MNAKAIEGVKHSRMACMDQLKEIIKEVGKSLKSHGESSRLEWSENQNKTEWDLFAIPPLCSYKSSLSNQNPSFLIFVMFVFP